VEERDSRQTGCEFLPSRLVYKEGRKEDVFTSAQKQLSLEKKQHSHHRDGHNQTPQPTTHSHAEEKVLKRPQRLWDFPCRTTVFLSDWNSSQELGDVTKEEKITIWPWQTISYHVSWRRRKLTSVQVHIIIILINFSINDRIVNNGYFMVLATHKAIF